MRRILGTFGLLVAIGTVGPASASEVVYFANGSSMPIHSHRIEGDMVHVVLGGESEMAFPVSLIERIENEDGVRAELRPSNRMAPSVPEGLARRLRLASGADSKAPPVTYGGRVVSDPSTIPGNNSPYHGGLARAPGDGPRGVSSGDPRLNQLGVGAPTEIQRRLPNQTTYRRPAVNPKAPGGTDATKKPAPPSEGDDKGKQAP